MLAHIFIYRLRCLLRDRETIFWTMLFPLLLAVLFNMAFSNLNSGESFKAIDIAVVENKQYSDGQFFTSALNEVSKGDNRLFKLTIASIEEADRLLKDNSVDGYIIAEDPVRLVVNKSGMKQNIIKSFLDNYMHTASAVGSILREHPEKQQEVLSKLGDRKQYVREVSGTNAEPNNVLIFFYTLIAMSCFYGGFFGMREITDIQADISPLAARINIAPVHKLKAFLISMSASLLINIAEILLLLLFLQFVIGVDFGPKAGYVILTAIAGSITGVTFGAFISALVKKREGIKTGILVGVSMVGSFLAGMMNQSIKYIVSQKIPILSYLNPINLLTDALYCLYYYDTFDRILLNIGVLLIFIVLFCMGTYFIIRRRKYASL